MTGTAIVTQQVQQLLLPQDRIGQHGRRPTSQTEQTPQRDPVRWPTDE
ncbi:MAG: hypothetical protein H7838_08085 [Magnetococcus sp. DMHC-8]